MMDNPTDRTIIKTVQVSTPEFVCKCGTTYRGFTKKEIEEDCEYCKQQKGMDERKKKVQELRNRIGIRTLNTCSNCVLSDWQDALTCYFDKEIPLFVADNEMCREWEGI